MDPLGDSTESDGKGLPSSVEDEFCNSENEEDNNISITRSVQIFLTDFLYDRSPSILNSSLSEKNIDEEDPLDVDISFADIKQNEVGVGNVDGVEEDPKDVCGEIVIKQEPKWEDEEINIVDDHLDSLSKCPRKRIRELKKLLREETEDTLEGWSGTERNNIAGNEKRYGLRQRAPVYWRRDLSYKPNETKKDKHEKENIWSDNSDNDPDYAPHDEETEEESYKTDKKTKRKFVLSMKRLCRRKLEHKRLVCPYCNKKYKIIVRHILTAHSNEPEVKNILSLPAGSQERKETLAAFLMKIEEIRVAQTEDADEEGQQIKKNVNAKEFHGHAFQKLNVCFYCGKRSSKLSRHMILIHGNEPYMKYLISLPKGSEERKIAFQLITNKGNYAYNQEVIANGKGSLITKRAQHNQDQIHNFASCKYCFGFYKKHLLQQHEEKCSKVYHCGVTYEEITRNYKYVEDCQGKIDRVKVKKKRPRRKLKPPPANVKVSVCFYCKARVRFISKHLVIHHSEKPYMKHLLSLPKGSEDRKIAWKLIRNKGNFAYNKEVIVMGGGSIISSKMQKGRDQITNFLPCSYCLGFFKKQLLQKHEENCIKKSESNKMIVNDEDEDWNVIPPDCTPMDIIQNLVKGNLVGEESDINLKIKKNSVKRTACYYCDKLTTKLMRHLEMHHPDKPDVKNILTLKKGSKVRYQALQVIRRKGNFLYNKSALNTTDGIFITRRTLAGSNKLNYLPCEFCFGFFTLNTLIKHVYKCERNTMSVEAKNYEIKRLCELKRKREINTFCTTLLNCRTSCSSNVNKILLSLKNTTIGTVAKNDELILKYGAYLLESGKMSTNSIVRKMCCLAKLVIRVNVFESRISNLLESFCPDVFKTVLKAALQICMTTKDEIAIRREKSLRISIRHCCMIAKHDSLVQKDDTSLKQINDFFVLFTEHWSKPLLATLLEDNKIIGHKDKFNEPDAKEDTKQVCVIDLIKHEFLQNLSTSTRAVSNDNNIDHCSSLFGKKVNVCLFCNKKYKCISRHWTKSHKDEPEIKTLTKLEKYSNEWKSHCIALRNKGNYLHNKTVLQQKKGCLFRKHGRAVLNGYSDFLPCEYCLGFYKAKRLTRHLKCCPLNPLLQQSTPINIRVRKKVQIPLLMNDFENKTPALKVLVDQMENSTLKQTIGNDDLIMKYGRIYLSQNPIHSFTYKITSFRLRNLARILDRCQKCNNQIKTLSDCFQPERFGYVLSALKEMSHSRSTKSSALAHFLQLRLSILTCMLILKNEFFLKNNESKLKDLSDCEVMLNQCMLSAEDFKQYDDKNCLSQEVSNAITNDATCGPRGKVKHWQKEEEADAILSHFSSHIENGVTPGKLEIENFINKHGNLKFQDWVRVKHKIRNIIVKNKRHSSHKGSITECIKSQISSDSSRIHSEILNQCNSDSFNPPKCFLPVDEFQDKRPVNEEMPSLTVQGNTSLQNVGITKDQQNSRNSSYSVIKDLEDLCDETRLPFLNKPLATIENQRGNFNENCPSDNEERTYLLLSSCDYSQQQVTFEIQDLVSSVESTFLTSKDASNMYKSHKQHSLTNASLHNPSTLEIEMKNDHVAGFETKSRSTVSTDLQGSQHECLQLSRGGNVSNQEENKHRSDGSISSISPLVSSNRYRNKGLHRSWKNDEINAVLSFFAKNIKRGKVPSKVECLDCIEENQCLNLRDWVSVKSKVCYIIRSNNKVYLKCNVKNRSTLKETEGNRFGDLTYVSDSNVIESHSSIDFVSSFEKRKKSKIGITKQQWTPEENTAINSFFKEHINNHTVPGKKDCEKCISLNKCLASRSWVVVKSKVHNIITYNKRKC